MSINCAKRNDYNDLEVSCESLLHFLDRGKRTGGRSTERSQALRVHQVLVRVMDELWVRKVALPLRARDKVSMRVHSQGNEGLASSVANLPTVEGRQVGGGTAGGDHRETVRDNRQSMDRSHKRRLDGEPKPTPLFVSRSILND